MAVLNREAFSERLKGLPEWTQAGKAIQRKYTFKTFVSAIAFVNELADAAEKAGHHPDITINYNEVGISLSTHSEGGVTEKDLALARQTEEIATRHE